jgi:lipopolysaccharide transport system permease protein
MVTNSSESVNEQQVKWDLEIRPKTKLFELHLNDIWKYRDLLFLFVKRDFVSQYKQTILGPLWHIIQPLLTTLIFLFLFGRIARMETDGIEPALFYMSGITIWNYFSACLSHTSSTFLSNSAIFGKVYFPRLVIPISVIISNIIRFGIQFLLLITFMLWFLLYKDVSIEISYRWLFIPLLVFLMAGIGFGLGIIFSSLTTKYRDVSFLLTFAIQLGMYASPVAYPSSFLNGTGYEWVVAVNPLTAIIEAFRYCLFGKGLFNVNQMVFSIAFMLIVVTVGTIMFNKVEKDFMDTV